MHHGRINIAEEYYPVIITNKSLGKEKIQATEVYDTILASVMLE